MLTVHLVTSELAPPELTLNRNVIDVASPAGSPWATGCSGLSIVVAVAVASWPSPAALTACTFTATWVLLPRPVNLAAVAPVTSWLLPLADTTYFVIGRPFSLGAAQFTVTVPALSAADFALRPTGVLGTV